MYKNLLRFYFTLFFLLTTNTYATTITPVAIEINDEVKVNSITYTNDSKFEVLVQPNQMRWVQENGKDKYIETNDLYKQRKIHIDHQTYLYVIKKLAKKDKLVFEFKMKSRCM